MGGTGNTNLVRRDAMVRLSFEGLAMYANGVTYYGDENRPSNGVAGGAFFKFIPTTLRTGSKPITNLADSPLVADKVYGFRAGIRGTDYGQASETGMGAWVLVASAPKADLRALAPRTS